MQRPSGRVILEHVQALEQRLAGRDGAAGAHLHQRAVLVLADLGLLGLHLLQPIGQPGVPWDSQACRQGIDEQPHHALVPGQLCRAAGYGNAKRNLVQPGITAEQNRPGPLHQCVQCQVVLPGGGL